MPDTPPNVLRDTLFIWMYSTFTVLEKIARGEKGAKDVLNDLESGGYINRDNKDNQQTAQEVVRLIANNPNTFINVRQFLTTQISVLLNHWTGPDPHPSPGELQSVYGPPRP
jgi:hypothetical protein